MRFVCFFGRGAQHVPERPPLSFTPRYISLVSHVWLQVWRRIHLGLLPSPPTDNAVSCARYSQGSPFRALGVIAWGHIARMAALKHVNQEGKLLNLCAGVRKMLLKKHGFAFSVMSGARKCGARVLRTNQREGVESSAARPTLTRRSSTPPERDSGTRKGVFQWGRSSNGKKLNVEIAFPNSSRSLKGNDFNLRL